MPLLKLEDNFNCKFLSKSYKNMLLIIGIIKIIGMGFQDDFLSILLFYPIPYIK